MTDLSIVIPVFQTKVEQFERCIKTACQTGAEVIVVDDGSEDSFSRKYQYLCTSFNINYIRQNHSGVSDARNKGLEVATGKMIYFLDSDDCLTDCGIATLAQIKYIPDTIQWFGFVLNDQIHKPQLAYTDFRRLIRGLFIWEQAMNHMYPTVVWNKVFDRLWLKKNQLLFHSQLVYGEDLVFMYELYLFNPKIQIDEQAIVEYFIYPDSLSHYQQNLNHIDLLELIKVLYQLSQLDNRYISEMSEWVWRHLYDHWKAHFQSKSSNKETFCRLLLASQTKYFLANSQSIYARLFQIPSYSLWNLAAKLRLIKRRWK